MTTSDEVMNDCDDGMGLPLGVTPEAMKAAIAYLQRNQESSGPLQGFPDPESHTAFLASAILARADSPTDAFARELVHALHPVQSALNLVLGSIGDVTLDVVTAARSGGDPAAQAQATAGINDIQQLLLIANRTLDLFHGQLEYAIAAEDADKKWGKPETQPNKPESQPGQIPTAKNQDDLVSGIGGVTRQAVKGRKSQVAA